MRAERILQDRLHANEKIEFLWDSEVKEIVGDSTGMTGAIIHNKKTGVDHELKADGLFVAIGHDPATDLFKGQIKMNERGYIDTAPDSTATSIPGVYAAGDVSDETYRQAVTAAGMGCMAALEADKFLHSREDSENTAKAAE